VRIVKTLVVLAMFSYPFLVYGGLRLLTPRTLALALGGALLVREAVRLRAGSPSPLLLPLALVATILALSAAFNEGRFFLFVPVLINGALFVSFVRTLIAGPSMVEHLARRRLTHVTLEDVVYCRRVTEVWCVFFLVNGALSLWLALRAPIEVWTLYTGLIAYLLVGAVFSVELTYRAWRFRRYDGDVTDVFLRRLFPPGPAR